MLLSWPSLRMRESYSSRQHLCDCSDEVRHARPLLARALASSTARASRVNQRVLAFASMIESSFLLAAARVTNLSSASNSSRKRMPLAVVE